ncbi:MCE-family protein [Mycobacterium tuberculosis CAS/NITR204]|uniref:MCE-family protein n=1 Tax=Mycobacterium tuberculosis CAS/NITR204 TaxID=1310114 RepID=R4MBA2_MYCTX|nr:MCE-family protein [Mycobacterium tuberculosis CAS/NITR204]
MMGRVAMLTGSRGLRYATVIALVAALVGGVYVLSSTGNKRTIVGYFTSAVGLYPGDQVRVLGVPVGEIDMIEPRSSDVKITMSVSKDVKVPVDVQAVIMSPNLVAARFIQLTPVYTGGAVLPDNGRIDLDRTAVPVEWDEVKEGLTRLAADLSRSARASCRGRWARRSTRPRTPLTATETRYTTRCASLRRSPGGWGIRAATSSAPSRTCRYWSTRYRRATSRLCSSPATWHRCRRCSPTARPIWTRPWARSTRRCPTSGGSCARTTRR